MVSKRASSISDCFSEVELAFFQAGLAGPAGADQDAHADEAGQSARPSFWSRLVGRLRR